MLFCCSRGQTEHGNAFSWQCLPNYTPLSSWHDREGFVHTLPWKCIAMLCLSSTAAKQHSAGRYGRSAIFNAGRLQTSGRDPYFWSMAFYLGQWSYILAGDLPQHSRSGSEASLRLVQFLEVQISANRANMWHGDGFPSKADWTRMQPSSQGYFIVFIA